jgi:tetratricopeptide (TPR) repeat protein
MAISSSDACLSASRAAVVLVGLTLCGCSFDLGSFSLGPDKEATPKPSATPTAEINAANVKDAQGYATQGQALARAGKSDEAMAQFERALALDSYNVQALGGRGLIRQAKRHAERSRIFRCAARHSANR